MKSIGKRIRKEREKLGFPLTEFASKIGISKQSLYKYEIGIVTNIPLDNLIKIAKALQCSPAYLMGWEDASYTVTEPSPLPDAETIYLLDDEKSLVSDYRKLNAIGKDKAREYINDLTDNEKYTENLSDKLHGKAIG